MATIIVAFPKMDEAKAIRNFLLYKGYDVAPEIGRASCRERV